MIRLTRFLENPFDDRDISLAELLSFSTDHLARMIANNAGGELTARITATTSALDLVEDSATDDQTKKAIRKARNQVKDTFRAGLPAAVAKVHGAVVAHYGSEAPELVECFPQGRSVFSNAPDDGLEQHLATLLNGVTAHQADLGAPLVTTVTGLGTQWAAVLDASGTSTGAVTATQEEKKLARENLQLMLFLNLLKLAEMFARQPETLPLYMQQSLLEDHPAEEEEEPEPPAPPVEP